jgi:fatty acid/phospholipid biosynthesis enzyme
MLLKGIYGVDQPVTVGFVSYGEKKAHPRVLRELDRFRANASAIGATIYDDGNGLIEPTHMKQGGVDLAVCTGEIGNMLIKEMAASSRLVLSRLKEAIETGGLCSKLAGLFLRLGHVKERLGREYSPEWGAGAYMLPLGYETESGPVGAYVLKTHGVTSAQGVTQVLRRALDYAGNPAVNPILTVSDELARRGEPSSDDGK